MTTRPLKAFGERSKKNVWGEIHIVQEKRPKNAVFDYIEIFYNRKRRHSYLGYLSPDCYENQKKEEKGKALDKYVLIWYTRI